MAGDVREMLRNAHSLDGGREANNDLYRNWAEKYDEHVLGAGYLGPHICGLLVQQAAGSSDPKVLDVGCGTGLVGRELQRLLPGATLIGADLSPDMATSAEKTGVYERVFAGIDLNEPLPESLGGPFDIVVCCGTFSLGHVGPGGVEHLIRATPQGGQTIFSVRRKHSIENDFEAVVASLVDRKLAVVVSALGNAPYIADEGADYWTLRRL